MLQKQDKPFAAICNYDTVPTYKGRFIMFSVITNIYNKKTKGSTLMELFTATGKPKTDIQVVATHASECVATT